MVSILKEKMKMGLSVMKLTEQGHGQHERNLRMMLMDMKLKEESERLSPPGICLDVPEYEVGQG